MVVYKQEPSPLGWDANGKMVRFPPEAVACKVRRATLKPGRPSIVAGEEGPLHISPDASMRDLRIALRGETGMFSLHPVDAAGNELEPVAQVEVVSLADGNPMKALVAGTAGSLTTSPDVETTRAYAQVPLRIFDLFGQMLASRDAHDEVVSGLLKTLVTSTATIQQSTAGLLNTANTTVKVANGVEALERAQAPQLDIDGLTEKVTALEKLQGVIGALGKGGKSETPWVVQLLNGPIGMGIMSFVNNFAQAAANAHVAAAQAAAAQASAEADDDSDDSDDSDED